MFTTKLSETAVPGLERIVAEKHLVQKNEIFPTTTILACDFLGFRIRIRRQGRHRFRACRSVLFRHCAPAGTGIPIQYAALTGRYNPTIPECAAVL